MTEGNARKRSYYLPLKLLKKFPDGCRFQPGPTLRALSATLTRLVTAALKDPRFLAKLHKLADSGDLKHDFKSAKPGGKCFERVRELLIEGVVGHESVDGIADRLAQRAMETDDEREKQLCLGLLKAIGGPFEPPKRGKPSKS